MMLSTDFLPFFLAFMKAMDPISLMFVLIVMFIVLRVFNMFCIPSIPLQSSSLIGGSICLGVT